jgi:hypothetical protein
MGVHQRNCRLCGFSVVLQSTHGRDDMIGAQTEPDFDPQECASLMFLTSRTPTSFVFATLANHVIRFRTDAIRKSICGRAKTRWDAPSADAISYDD